MKKKTAVIFLILSITALVAIIIFCFVMFFGNDSSAIKTPTPDNTDTAVEETQTARTEDTDIPADTPFNTAQTTVQTEATGTGNDTPDATIVVSYSSEIIDIVKMEQYQVGKVSYYLPEITGSDDDTAMKIQNAVCEEIRNIANDYKAQCEFFSLDYNPEEPTFYEYSTGFTAYIYKDYISFRILSNADYGDRSEPDVKCLCFSLKTGEKLEIDDLGINKSVLSEEAIDVSLSLPYDYADNYRDKIRTIICNEWYIKDNTIVLVYKPLVIASEMNGIIEIPVSLNNL